MQRKGCLPARYAVRTCMADPPWSMGAAGRPLRVERTCCTCASGAQGRLWSDQMRAGGGDLARHRGAASRTRHRAQPAQLRAQCADHLLAAGLEVRGCAGVRVCGCAGGGGVGVRVWWWEAVVVVGGGVRGAGQQVHVVPGAGWAGEPEASGRAGSPSREAASAARVSSCPAAAAAGRSGPPARPSPRGSSQATAAAAARPLVRVRVRVRVRVSGRVSVRVRVRVRVRVSGEG